MGFGNTLALAMKLRHTVIVKEVKVTALIAGYPQEYVHSNLCLKRKAAGMEHFKGDISNELRRKT